MPSPTVIVSFALPEESRDFRAALQRNGRSGVRIEHFGVGPAIASERVARWLDEGRPRLLICAGFAGGLDSRLALGDLVVAENLTTPEVLAGIRASSGAKLACHFGSIVSRAVPVESIAEKAALFQETNALAVDMESEAVAAACRAAGVPLLVVRAISDPAGAPLPVPFGEWFDLPGQRPRVIGLLRYLALHPSRIRSFAAFVRGLAPARRALAAFLIQLLAEGKV